MRPTLSLGRSCSLVRRFWQRIAGLPQYFGWLRYGARMLLSHIVRQRALQSSRAMQKYASTHQSEQRSCSRERVHETSISSQDDAILEAQHLALSVWILDVRADIAANFFPLQLGWHSNFHLCFPESSARAAHSHVDQRFVGTAERNGAKRDTRSTRFLITVLEQKMKHAFTAHRTGQQVKAKAISIKVPTVAI